MSKVYLGDSVYCEMQPGGTIILTTENGLEATNRIIMEPEVLASFFENIRPEGNHGALEYVRSYYNVPAYIDKAVEVGGHSGVVVGGSNAHVLIKLKGDPCPRRYHPTDPDLNWLK